MNFKQGDIVTASLLFSEQAGIKKRPALVISNAKFNKNSEDIILLKITSKGQLTEYDVVIKQSDLEEGRLKIESMVRVDNPVTTFRQLIEAKIGRISAQKLSEIKQKTRELYSL